MSNDTNLQFIIGKINQVRSAIMYSSSDDVIRLPNNIVSAVKVDEEGRLWFVCDRPPYMPDQYPSSFPARLHFYRKGKFFHIEVSGPASIVNNVQPDSNSTETRMLIKMEMRNIVYTETPVKQKGGLELWLTRTSGWILQHIGVSKQSKPFLNSLMTIERH